MVVRSVVWASSLRQGQTPGKNTGAGVAGRMEDRGWKWFEEADQSAAAGELGVNVVLLLAMIGFTLFRFNYVVKEQASLEAKYFPVGATVFLAQSQPPPNLVNYCD